MGPRLIVLVNPDIEIGLQLVDETIHLFAERKVPSRKWLEFEGDVISSLICSNRIGVGAPMEITP